MCSGKNYHTKTKKKEMQFRTRNKMMKARTKKNTTQYNDSQICFLANITISSPAVFQRGLPWLQTHNTEIHTGVWVHSQLGTRLRFLVW